MLRIHASVLIGLLVLVFLTGAVTAGLALGLAAEGFWFIAGAAAVGFPLLVAWMVNDYLVERNR